MQPDQFAAFRTILNFRDLGGLRTVSGRRTKAGMLLRSGALDRASRAELDELGRRGLRTVVDLRAADEIRRRPDRLPSHVHFRNVPFDTDRLARQYLKGFLHEHAGSERVADTMGIVYRDLVTNHLPELRHLFDILVEPQAYPVLIHCQGGKDRTGFAAALVLLTLGVDRETVLSEYLLTNDLLRPRVDRALSIVRLVTLGIVSTAALRPIFVANREYLLSALRTIEFEFGSVEQYIERYLGMTAEKRQALAELLLE